MTQLDERADYAQTAAADEAARIRADHRQALDQLTVATNARTTALEEARDSLRVRAGRAEAALDAARADHKRLAEELAEAPSADDVPAGTPAPRPPSALSGARQSAGVRKPSVTRGDLRDKTCAICPPPRRL